MDIQVSSNFERALFDVYDRDGGAVAQLMDELKTQGGFKISQGALERLRGLFASGRCIGRGNPRHDRPGECGNGRASVPAQRGRRPCRAGPSGATPMITLATAHPAKFPDAVEASGIRPACPRAWRT
jgi:threonine synthase